ncbi:hypothetical protein [Actinomadura livida]|uniref:Recombinase A n=1 Tax=Actinomadura livida TaxID=79909 RepID=A0A7W7ICL8_9ACTN|nr:MULTISPECIES: hypothetical protein [Actinomadura]MBB4774526.1 hypothetical protein [Actinomadura catellatispora]GGT81936.1 hypothetical protein GCM10010208_00190 [Actinomadura livida]
MPEAALRELVRDTAPPGARDTVPVLPALGPAVPGGLRPGSVVGLPGPGAASLGLALVAGVSRHGGEDGTGGWCGVVGLPEFGVAAAAGMGAAPERLLLVDEPGERWPDVVAALCEAVDLVLLCPPERPGAAAVRRLSALARKHGCVLTLTGAFAGDWAGTRLRLRMDGVVWDGLADGHGRLTGRRAEVVAEGRDAPGPGRRARVWLPAPDGTVKPDETVRPPLELVPEPVAHGGPVHRRPSALPPRVRVPVEEGIA